VHSQYCQKRQKLFDLQKNTDALKLQVISLIFKDITKNVESEQFQLPPMLGIYAMKVITINI
jgi:hypothetical protein